jgi:outer membrane protein OmpA-like peptidoglycan-associated protein
MKIVTRNIAMIAMCGLLLTGCEATKNANNKQKGGVIGAAGGAVIGAILGNNLGNGNNSELGAVIGGVVGGTAGVLLGNKMDKQAQQIEEEIPGAQVERVDDAIVITFDENSGVYFKTAQYSINAESDALLTRLSNVMKDFADTNIIVAGHTDDVGPDASNMTLSKNRAESVTSFLTNKGLSSSRFTTMYYGESQPAHSNATAEGRAKNRRVTLAIVPNEAMKNEAIRESKSGN